MIENNNTMRFLSLILILFLSSCSTQVSQKNEHIKVPKTQKSRYSQAKDSAPKGPVPVTFKEVKPKNEPFSRYGNPDSYTVEGKNYRVMRNAGGYKARGTASWYGTKFHKRKTSSGEKYDMYALTAAHKTLPLPTYVRIKNLKNGQEAIVKVNDRGPFHSSRIIDLSYGAAAKLKIFPEGTAPVEIEALEMGKRVAHYYVQAGAFSSAALAQSLKTKLARLTPSPVLVEQYKNRYIVKVGPFANKKMSDSLKMRLASNGVKGSFSLLQ